jgi:hypothetical protein
VAAMSIGNDWISLLRHDGDARPRGVPSEIIKRQKPRTYGARPAHRAGTM